MGREGQVVSLKARETQRERERFVRTTCVGVLQRYKCDFSLADYEKRRMIFFFFK